MRPATYDLSKRRKARTTKEEREAKELYQRARETHGIRESIAIVAMILGRTNEEVESLIG